MLVKCNNLTKKTVKRKSASAVLCPVKAKTIQFTFFLFVCTLGNTLCSSFRPFTFLLITLLQKQSVCGMFSVTLLQHRNAIRHTCGSIIAHNSGFYVPCSHIKTVSADLFRVLEIQKLLL